MRRIALLAVFAGALASAGCKDQQTTEAAPPAVELTTSVVGHYCGMNVLEHSGPKAQIILASRKEPVWFSSARDAFSFTMLPEEPKDIRAIYVSDMGKAPSWDKPGSTNWIDAKSASFVLGSRMKGGMGADEADYLLYINGKAIGVVEAKKVGLPLMGVETQSEKFTTSLLGAVYVCLALSVFYTNSFRLKSSPSLRSDPT